MACWLDGDDNDDQGDEEEEEDEEDDDDYDDTLKEIKQREKLKKEWCGSSFSYIAFNKNIHSSTL